MKDLHIHSPGHLLNPESSNVLSCTSVIGIDVFLELTKRRRDTGLMKENISQWHMVWMEFMEFKWSGVYGMNHDSVVVQCPLHKK